MSGFVAAPGTDFTFGDTPKIAAALDALGKKLGVTITGTSGHRTLAKQTDLWNNRGSNPYPVARPTPNAPHIVGTSADATINGVAIQKVISAEDLRAFGLEPLAGDAVHVSWTGKVAASNSGFFGTAWDTLKDTLGPPGGDHDLAAKAAETVTDAANDALKDTAGDVGKALGWSAEQIAEPVASALLSKAQDAIGKDLMRWTLYAVLVAGGLGLFLFGGARVLGAGPSPT
ncbi:MAG TPA: hypothetical protein VN962_05435 [Polyangia bacterium]|nr:hypothetical protein [Polyangia bacterium]